MYDCLDFDQGRGTEDLKLAAWALSLVKDVCEEKEEEEGVGVKERRLKLVKAGVAGEEEKEVRAREREREGERSEPQRLSTTARLLITNTNN